MSYPNDPRRCGRPRRDQRRPAGGPTAVHAPSPPEARHVGPVTLGLTIGVAVVAGLFSGFAPPTHVGRTRSPSGPGVR